MQINVADANIVDRCESCHMGTREPLKITAAAMTAKGEKKPDEYAKAFVSHPEPELLQIHDPDKFGCSPCHQGNGRATTSIEKAHGNYEHWLWPLYPKENSKRAARPATPPTWCWSAAMCGCRPSTTAKICSVSAAAWAAIATRATTRNLKI